MPGDFHTHSTASDGIRRPAEIIRLAKRIGLTFISLTDHDTLSGLEEAREAAREAGLVFVPGVEINTDWEGKEVHILAYDFDFDSLERTLAFSREGREERMKKMLEKVRDRFGAPIGYDEILEEAREAPPARPHLARVMVRRGLASSTREAFDLYLDRNGPVYVERDKLTPFDAVRDILNAGGIPVLAHPGLVGDDELIRQLVSSGLAGLEVAHPEHDAAEVLKYRRMADDMGLFKTAGSDYHGEVNALGEVKMPDEWLTPFLSRQLSS